MIEDKYLRDLLAIEIVRDCGHTLENIDPVLATSMLLLSGIRYMSDLEYFLDICEELMTKARELEIERGNEDSRARLEYAMKEFKKHRK